MKRKLLLLLVLLTVTTVKALAVDVDSIRYSLKNDGTASVADCLYKSTPNIVIPSTITSGGNTYTVKSINSWVFDSKTFITSITLPSTLESIGYRAFRYLRIKSLTLPEGLVSIDSEVFCDCDSLTTITLPASLQTLGSDVFNGCDKVETVTFAGNNDVVLNRGGQFANMSQLKSVRLPSGLTRISNSMFYNCKLLESINLSSTAVTEIGERAFNYCNSLTAVTLPATLQTLGNHAFSNCAKVETVSFAGNNDVVLNGDAHFAEMPLLKSVRLPNGLTTISQYMFYYCTMLEGIDLSSTAVTEIRYMAFYRCQALATAAFPATLTSIGGSAFAENNISRLQLNNGLVTIGNGAFYKSKNLAEAPVVIPQSVTTIGDEAFRYCSKMTSITFPDGLSSLGKTALANCDSLKTVVFGKNLTQLPENVCYYDTKLVSVTLPAKLESIGVKAFNYCTSLVSITIPSKVTAIGAYAFSYCSLLETVEMRPTTMSSIGNSVFEHCKKLTAIRIPEGIEDLPYDCFNDCKALEEVTLPSTLKTIGSKVFCDSPIKSISLPEGLVSIGSQAFYNCDSLKAITLPATLQTLGNQAFCYCDKVESVSFVGNNDVELSGESHFAEMPLLRSARLPNGLSTISRYMFYNCKMLESIDLSRTTVTEIPRMAFYRCHALTTIAFPATLTTIGSNAFEENNISRLQLNNGLVTIGSQAFYKSKNLAEAPVVIPQSVTTIGNEAFRNSTKMTSITFPDGLSTLGTYAIAYCDSLKTVDFGRNLTQLPAYVCCEDKNIESITLPENLESIGAYAFYDLVLMEAITLPNTLSTIGNYAFYNWNRLKELALPTSIASIGEYAFNHCDSLYSVTFPENPTELTFSSYIFSDCPRLVNVKLPKTGTATIGNYMFKNCYRLRNIELPTSLTSIGNSAFYDCDSLQTIYIPDGVTSIGSDAFYGCYGLRYVRLPEGLQTIGGSCFCYDERLVFINIPSTVTSIGDWAFHTTATSSNNSFKSIGIMGSTMPETNTHLFWQNQPAFSFLVPEGYEEDYLNGAAWTPNNNDNRTIKGYPSSKQTMTQDLIHISMLDNESYKDGSPKAVIVDWFEGMGNYRVYYTDKNGHKSTTMPENTGEYTISLAFEEGPYYKARTFNNVATLTLLEIADEDFELLWDFYQKTYDWTRKTNTWNGYNGNGTRPDWGLLEGRKESAVGIRGVKWNNGHVEEIDLNSNANVYNINAHETPVSILALPQVKKVVFQDKGLYGNISDKVEEWLASGKTLSPTLEYLDLQNNKLEGNVSTLVNALPALKTLDVQKNRFSTVWPALPATLSNVNISNQTITDIVATVDLRDMSESGFFSTLPSIIFYDPSTRTYADNISINIKSKTNNNSFNLNYAGDNDFSVSGGCLWKGESGNIANCSYKDAQNKTTSFGAYFLYDMGDVDFNGGVDVLDLQQSINYLFKDSYSGYSRYNFTAGDLNADESINVLDIVLHVDILLSLDMPTTNGAKARQAKEKDTSAAEAEAKLFVKNGLVQLQTTRPVATIDMMLSCDEAERISWHNHAGMTVAKKSLPGNRVHVIIYSLAGKTLPIGETILASNASDGSIEDATLVDEEVKVINTALNDAEAELTTGIEMVTEEVSVSSESGIYTIQGQAVGVDDTKQLPKGIYIVNGKKVIIK